MTLLAYLAGVAALVIFAVLAVTVPYGAALADARTHTGLVPSLGERRIIRSRFALKRLVEGADGRLSTSKAQWFVWTAVVVFAYVAIYTARAINGHPEGLGSVPHNVLIALGFSTATMAAAKGITSYYVSTGRIRKPANLVPAAAAPPLPPGSAAATGAAAPPSRAADLVQDDSGQTDLSKVQLIAWTIIAIGVYLGNVVAQVQAIAAHGIGPGHSGALPDIDAALTVLIGLSQGAYLGKKVVTSSTLTGQSVAPRKQTPGGSVSLYGTGCGAQRAVDARLLLDGFDRTAWITFWTDTRITFVLDPVAAPSGQPWQLPSQEVDVAVQVAGQMSTPAVTLTVVPPVTAAVPARTRLSRTTP